MNRDQIKTILLEEFSKNGPCTMDSAALRVYGEDFFENCKKNNLFHPAEMVKQNEDFFHAMIEIQQEDKAHAKILYNGFYFDHFEELPPGVLVTETSVLWFLGPDTHIEWPGTEEEEEIFEDMEKDGNQKI